MADRSQQNRAVLDALKNLEQSVYDAHRWSRLIMDLSDTSSQIDPEGLGVVADAMSASAKELRAAFTAAWIAAGGAACA